MGTTRSLPNRRNLFASSSDPIVTALNEDASKTQEHFFRSWCLRRYAGFGRAILMDTTKVGRSAHPDRKERQKHGPGDLTGFETGWRFQDPGQCKTAFLAQLCLSQGAGVSIILPTLPRKPWYCFPKDLGTQPQPVKRLSFSASECLKTDLHFRISQEH